MYLLHILAGTAMIATAWAQDIKIETWVQKADYCRQDDGRKVVEFTVALTYMNVGDTTAIVPRFGMLVGWTAVPRRGSQVQKSETLMSEGMALSLEFWAGKTPNPNNFAVLLPGETARAGTRSIMMLASAIAPGEYRLALRMDHGPRFPAGATISPKPWKDIGQLLTEVIDTDAVKVSIADEAPTRACGVHVGVAEPLR